MIGTLCCARESGLGRECALKKISWEKVREEDQRAYRRIMES